MAKRIECDRCGMVLETRLGMTKDSWVQLSEESGGKWFDQECWDRMQQVISLKKLTDTEHEANKYHYGFHITQDSENTDKPVTVDVFDTAIEDNDLAFHETLESDSLADAIYGIYTYGD